MKATKLRNWEGRGEIFAGRTTAEKIRDKKILGGQRGGGNQKWLSVGKGT